MAESLHACLPGFGLGYNPYNPLGMPGISLPGIGGLGGIGGGYPYGGGLGGIGGYPRIGPFRSQANHDPTQHHVQVQNPSVLNCRNFDEPCKWSNTNADDMEWIAGKTLPDVQRWFSTLMSSSVPDMSAGALISAQRRGWEGGQLISDALPCLTTGLRLTATAWKSKLGPLASQPKLQVCSRNMNEGRFPLINCNEMEIRNGVPMTVDVPAPNNPNLPAQIVISGNNFAAPEGGALFLQDIRVEGNLDCSVEGGRGPGEYAAAPDEHPTLVEPLDLPPYGGSPSKNAAPPPPPPPSYSRFDMNQIESIDAPPPPVPSPFLSLPPDSFGEAAIVPRVQQSPYKQSAEQEPEANPALYDTCLAISCDATDYNNCNFWRSSGGNQWEIATSKRIGSPKTSILTSPAETERFLVAPFNDAKEKQFTLVSETVIIPPAEDVFFCFYEHVATRGFSISICTDKFKCFYKHSAVEERTGPDANKWNLRCTKLPPGGYELRVVAENHGTERGEIGFLPVRLSRDSLANQLIC